MSSLRLLGLGAKLALAGGRAAVVRLLLMTLGLAVGVAMLLTALGVAPARSAYQEHEGRFYGTRIEDPEAASVPHVTHRWWLGTTFEERQVDVMALEGDPQAPVPPGITRLPRAGEVFASPDLTALLRSADGSLLRPRVPGGIVGTIRPEGLLEPHQLLAYVGASADLNLTKGEAEFVTAFEPEDLGQGPPVDAFTIVLLGATVASVLLPIALFVLTATRLSASTRESRLAAVRLAGGTQAQVRILAGVEVAITAVGGVILGVPAFLLARPLAVAILSRVVGHGFFVNDFAPPPLAAVAVLLAVPLFALGVAVLTMRRVVISPLGIARRSSRIRRGWFWPVGLATGLLGLLLAAANHEALLRQSSPIPGVVVGAALLVILIGLAGTAPWLAWVAARAIAQARPSPSVQIGARRLEAEPTSAGRVVMSVAVLLTLAAVGEAIFLSSARTEFVPPGAASLRPSDVAVRTYAGPRHRAEVWSSVEQVPGVESLEVSRRSPFGGTCGAQCGAIARTDGRADTVERIRNVIGWNGEAWTSADLYGSSESSRMVRLFQLAILFVLVVTAANLLVSTVDGMMERRRSLAVLSAIGVPGGVLRGSVLVQVGLPLVAALVLGTSTGLAVTELIFRVAGERAPLPIEPMLATAAAAGIMVLLVTTASFPWIRIVRRPELLRSE